MRGGVLRRKRSVGWIGRRGDVVGVKLRRGLRRWLRLRGGRVRFGRVRVGGRVGGRLGSGLRGSRGGLYNWLRLGWRK